MSLLDTVMAPVLAELTTVIYPAVLSLIGLFLAFAIAVYGVLFVLSLFLLKREDDLAKADVVTLGAAVAQDEKSTRDWSEWGAAWDDASGTGSADVDAWSRRGGG